MKLLLDENLPHRLRSLLVGHEVSTVAYMQWAGIENGSLLAMAALNGFDALVTMDSGIEYEQNRHNFHARSSSLKRSPTPCGTFGR